MYFTQAIYRLNIMFRHMPVPRDTSVSRQIIIVCCESVGNCQTLSKDGPSQLVNSIIFRPFFSLRPMSIVSYQFCPVPTCAHHVFCTLFTCLSIDSSLYHVIFSHVTVFSVFFVKGKVEFVTLSANFDSLSYEGPSKRYVINGRYTSTILCMHILYSFIHPHL